MLEAVLTINKMDIGDELVKEMLVRTLLTRFN